MAVDGVVAGLLVAEQLGEDGAGLDTVQLGVGAGQAGRLTQLLHLVLQDRGRGTPGIITTMFFK